MIAGRPAVKPNGWSNGQKTVDAETLSGNCCGERYFLLLGNGTVQRFQWHGTEFDHDTWKFGNCFTTSQDAERAREAVKVLLNYLRIEYER